MINKQLVKHFLISLCILHSFLAFATSEKQDVNTIKGITLALHEWASVEAGESRSLSDLRNLVTKDAYLVYLEDTASGRQSTKLNVLEFISTQGPVKEGFFETVTDMQIIKHEQAANVWANYEARNTQDGDIIFTGITNLQLFHDGSRWWVLGWVNIVNSEG